jgi:hypothetical protein
VPQAPVEAVGFRAEQQSHEPTAADSSADSSDAEPSTSKPGRQPGAYLVRTR